MEWIGSWYGSEASYVKFVEFDLWEPCMDGSSSNDRSLCTQQLRVCHWGRRDPSPTAPHGRRDISRGGTWHVYGLLRVGLYYAATVQDSKFPEIYTKT